MRPFRLLLLLAALLLAVPVAAQRPRSAGEALQRFTKVQEGSEAERRRPLGDLGDFDDPEITRILLAEVARAQEIGYLQAAVRALGQKARDGAVPALQKVLREATNNRLMDSAAEGLARQGAAGVQALGEVLAGERSGGGRRQACCEGLGRADGDAARDVLVHELRTAGGRDRLPPLRALARRPGDAVLDPLRIELAGDKDPLVAATALRQLADAGHAQAPALAEQLLKRLPADASAEHFTAALRGLLLDTSVAGPEWTVVAAAAAEDPFASSLLPAWTKALAVADFRRWLVEHGPARKNAAEREAVALALGLAAKTQAGEVAPGLLRLLGQKEPAVVRAAALGLVACGEPTAVPPLQKLLANGNEATGPIALFALHTMGCGDANWTETLMSHTLSKSAAVRAAALQLLPQVRIEKPRAVGAAAANLAHKSWQVRAAAIDLLVALREPSGIPLLIEHRDAEAARLLHDVDEALHELTRLRLADTAAWRAWWQKEGATFQVPPKKDAVKENGKDGGKGRDKPAATTATYWDIPVRSDRVVFVVDVSGSMNQPFGTGGGTRLDEAKRQLVRVFGLLPPKAKANVIVFGSTTDAFAETLQPIDDKKKKLVEAWAQNLTARTATNIHAAMQRAFADPEVDTIFLLSDGQPSTGDIVEPGPLAQAIAGWNLGRDLRIHTIALGGKSDFLERLARDSGGEHTVAR